MAAPSPVLVSAKWLSEMAQRSLGGPRLRVLDASWYLPMMRRDGRKEFLQAHIAGASFFDIDECVDPASKFDHTLPSPEIFADYVGNLGVGNDSHVVVYDASDFGAERGVEELGQRGPPGHGGARQGPTCAIHGHQEPPVLGEVLRRGHPEHQPAGVPGGGREAAAKVPGSRAGTKRRGPAGPHPSLQVHAFLWVPRPRRHVPAH
uniref:Thiosulfate sulfurtransferase n=1 Tax=Tetraodon nigroviridis TaxID=99883 RepID=H3C963_TETNG